LEELKVPYELKTYKRQNMLAPPELKKVHPLGKAPVLTVEAAGSSKPLVFAESSAIVEYICEFASPRGMCHRQ
jgi:glutathione S-transferase